MKWGALWHLYPSLQGQALITWVNDTDIQSEQHLHFFAWEISLASGDKLATGTVDQKDQKDLRRQPSTTNWQCWCINTPTPSLLGGSNCEVFFYTGFQNFPGGIKLQLPVVVAVLMMQLSFPVSLLTPFLVFPGTTSQGNDLHLDLYLKFFFWENPK